jgi:hypothetical protein
MSLVKDEWKRILLHLRSPYLDFLAMNSLFLYVVSCIREDLRRRKIRWGISKDWGWL